MDDMKELEQSLKTSISVSHNFKHISYSEKIAWAYQELMDTDPNSIIKRWREEWDNILWGIYTGKVYLVWADTWVGKTTFVNQVCRNVARTWARVVKYSLEDRMEDIGKEEIFYEMNRIHYKERWQVGWNWIKFVNHEYNDAKFDKYIQLACDNLMKENIVELDMKKQVNIDELVQLMEIECDNWTKLFAIDHLHYFEFDNNSENRLDLQIQNVMHKISEICRRRNVAIILVAHYRNNVPKLKTGEKPDYSRFKDWASIKQVANIIIQIERAEDFSYFFITKLRWPIKPEVLETQFDLWRFEYDFHKTQKQIEKEKIFIS